MPQSIKALLDKYNIIEKKTGAEVSSGEFEEKLTQPPLEIVLKLTFDGNPLAKSRPRFSRGRVYNPQKNEDYEEALGWAMKAELGQHEMDDINEFGLSCNFYRSTAQRIDVDNMIKTVCDAANNIVWKDDAQCIEVYGRVFRRDKNPRTEMVIYRIPDAESSPHKICPQCKIKFKSAPSIKTVFCSQGCFRASRQRVKICKFCKNEFEVPLAKFKRGLRNFCSYSCSSSYYGEIKSLEYQQKHRCKLCKGPVSRAEYTRCRACFIKIQEKEKAESFQD